ncbi:MAG TPA: SIMPL domain-containing protein [Methylomusa anaerophila]|uniref:26 kDa periplasmic immunogenic protein n=1 Tax=Methylomusa anaerophila TaxID=1930071 RepID=A0A348AG40_9FIRM|nr:SIMPL domain-containing protein [Methylomusa anaerophila]BBB90038.1 26 kDa periplasmic immunogenic protein precursor [Methylomusa anaerophila]HML88234.1 SIMPL domain-containing protein [Methylomusa anaerophila]
MKSKLYFLGKQAILLVLMMVLAATPVLAKEPSTGTEVTVSGNYEQEIAPDVAFVTMGAVTDAVNVKDAQEKNAELAARIQRQIEALGIKPEHIKTVNYSVTPVYEYADNGRRLAAIKSYQVSNNISVTAAPDQAGLVIDTALKAGANQVTSVRFGKKDETAAKAEAIQQAVKDALTKAEAIANVLNKHVSRIQAVNESGVYLQPLEMSRMVAKGAAADTATQPTPISPGLVHLTANVQVTVELE